MPEDDEIRITLRLPEGLRDRLKAASDESGRSMNAEIVTRLLESLDGSFVDPPTVSKINTTIRELMGLTDRMAEELSKSRDREAALLTRLDTLSEAVNRSTETTESFIRALVQQK